VILKFLGLGSTWLRSACRLRQGRGHPRSIRGSWLRNCRWWSCSWSFAAKPASIAGVRPHWRRTSRRTMNRFTGGTQILHFVMAITTESAHLLGTHRAPQSPLCERAAANHPRQPATGACRQQQRLGRALVSGGPASNSRDSLATFRRSVSVRENALVGRTIGGFGHRHVIASIASDYRSPSERLNACSPNSLKPC
jgi:hypothetical protein